MSPKRRFKKEYALELLQVAREDLDTAIVLKKGNVQRKENIFFHVQQAIEKALKAAICAREFEVPLVHDLNELVQTLADYKQIPHYDEIFDLTQFATIRRYEEGVAIFTEEEIAAAIQAAQDILDWAKGDLAKAGLK